MAKKALQFYSDTAANLATDNETFYPNVVIIESDTGLTKLADGVTAYASLPYEQAVAGGYATTATAAGTTTLTKASKGKQFFTGVTTQTVTMPVVSTLILGQQYRIVNLSTGLVTVNSSGGNAIIILAAGSTALLECIALTGTAAASWNATYNAALAATGKKLTISNTLTLAGTDATTMTFPSTSATIARTDAANAFTGNQSATGSILSSSASGGVGYATGAGSAVTQLTSRSTGVTINTPTGAITLVSAAGSATAFSFTVTNSSVAAGDTIHLSQKSGTDKYTTQVVTAVAAGSFQITLANATGTTTEQPVFNFTVVKGVSA